MKFGGEIVMAGRQPYQNIAKVVKRRTLKAILDDLQISSKEFIRLKHK